MNNRQAAEGRIGIALALPGGSTFAGGRHQLVVLNFAQCANSSDLPLISFTDAPIAREVVDLSANRLKAVFKDASGANPIEDAQFFVTQQYLDFSTGSRQRGTRLPGRRRSRLSWLQASISVSGCQIRW